MGAQQNNGRFFYIDSYRGIAALAVAWFHIYSAIHNPASNAFDSLIKAPFYEVALSYLAVWGRWGVRLFFVISGFVLAYSLQRKYLINSLLSIGRYLLRRSVRLDPTYWFALTLTLGLVYVVGDNTYMQEHGHAITSIPILLSNAFYLNWPLNQPFVLSVSWTLAIEMQLYILFSLLLYFGYLLSRFTKLGKENAVLIVIITFSGLALLWHLQPSFAPPLGMITKYFFIFMTGVLLYNSFIDKKYFAVLIAYSGILLISFVKDSNVQSIGALLCAALIYAAHYIPSFRSKLENKTLLYVGKLSYCIYLLHIPVGLLTATFFVRASTIFIDYTIGVRLSAAILSMMATIAASHFVNKFIEEKTIWLSKKIVIGKQVAKG